jgi:hypothetical protein
VTVSVGAEPYRVRVQDVDLNIGIKNIKIPRAALLKLVEDGAEVAEVTVGSVTLTLA